MVMVNLPDNSGVFFPVIHPGPVQIQVALPILYSVIVLCFVFYTCRASGSRDFL